VMSVLRTGFLASLHPGYMAFLCLAVFALTLLWGVAGLAGAGVLLGCFYVVRLLCCTLEALYFHLLTKGVSQIPDDDEQE